MLSNYMIQSNQIAIDFDGTITNKDGSLNKRAAKYIRKINKLGVKLILWTCRKEERYEEAVQKIQSWELPIDIPENKENTGKLSCIYSIDDRSVPGGKVPWLFTYLYIKNQVNLAKRSLDV